MAQKRIPRVSGEWSSPKKAEKRQGLAAEQNPKFTNHCRNRSSQNVSIGQVVVGIKKPLVD